MQRVVRPAPNRHRAPLDNGKASMGRILIVEDEEKIARFTELELMHEGYQVDKASEGRAGVQAALDNDYDLILLDIMLPGLNGLEVLRRVRKVKQTPVILLTARGDVMDKVAGLDAGADDYITKPFAIEELLARIRVALKHAPAGDANPVENLETTTSTSETIQRRNVLRAGTVTLDPDAHEIRVGEESVSLTAREFDVLRALMEQSDIVLSREQLMREACGWDFVGDTNAIDVYVSHIRSKIDKRFGIELVSAVRGVGYVVRTR